MSTKTILIEAEVDSKQRGELRIDFVYRGEPGEHTHRDYKWRIIDPQSAEPVASGENYKTGDTDLDLLLGLTDDIVSGKCNMDTAIWWQQTLAKVIERLRPIASGEQEVIARPNSIEWGFNEFVEQGETVCRYIDRYVLRILGGADDIDECGRDIRNKIYELFCRPVVQPIGEAAGIDNLPRYRMDMEPDSFGKYHQYLRADASGEFVRFSDLQHLAHPITDGSGREEKTLQMLDGTPLLKYLQDAAPEEIIDDDWTRGYEECRRTLYKILAPQLAPPQSEAQESEL